MIFGSNNKRVFVKPIGVNVEFTTAGAFDWVFADAMVLKFGRYATKIRMVDGPVWISPPSALMAITALASETRLLERSASSKAT